MKNPIEFFCTKCNNIYKDKKTTIKCHNAKLRLVQLHCGEYDEIIKS